MTRPLSLTAALAAALAAALCLLTGPADAANGPATARQALSGFADVRLDRARYDWARGCSKGPQPGTLALARWLEGVDDRGSLWGIYNCRKVRGSTTTFSLHAEGRALDWKLKHRRKADRRAASKIIGMLLGRDAQGRKHALARRMGVQEIVWNCRIWSARSMHWKRSQLCPPGGKVSVTLAHRDHIHIGLNRAGARKRTTFWRMRRRASGGCEPSQAKRCRSVPGQSAP